VLGVHPNELLRDASASHEREQQQREHAGTVA
jgi:hypothetical protein